MNRKKIQFVSYRKSKGIIILQDKIGSIAAKAFCRAISDFESRDESKLTIDLSKIERPYINGMLPIISMILHLKDTGCKVDIIQPKNSTVKKLFKSYNWTRLLTQSKIPQTKCKSKIAYTNRFYNWEDQYKTVNEFLDFVMG